MPGKAGFAMALRDVAIRNAKPGAKAIKLTDGGGMFLLVTPAGGKLWRLKYRVDGREKLLAIGAYPEIGLGEARRRREEARELIALGKDPTRQKQRDKVRARVWRPYEQSVFRQHPRHLVGNCCHMIVAVRSASSRCALKNLTER